MRLAEVFGTSVDDMSPEAIDLRERKWCRFRNNPCTKVRKQNPIGVCALGSGKDVTVVCPARFGEHGRVVRDAAALAFGQGHEVVVLPEYKLLSVTSEIDGKVRKTAMQQ